MFNNNLYSLFFKTCWKLKVEYNRVRRRAKKVVATHTHRESTQQRAQSTEATGDRERHTAERGVTLKYFKKIKNFNYFYFNFFPSKSFLFLLISICETILFDI